MLFTSLTHLSLVFAVLILDLFDIWLSHQNILVAFIFYKHQIKQREAVKWHVKKGAFNFSNKLFYWNTLSWWYTIKYFLQSETLVVFILFYFFNDLFLEGDAKLRSSDSCFLKVLKWTRPLGWKMIYKSVWEFGLDSKQADWHLFDCLSIADGFLHSWPAHPHMLQWAGQNQNAWDLYFFTANNSWKHFLHQQTVEGHVIHTLTLIFLKPL